MAKLKITQVRSRIGHPKDQKLTLDALGLKKMGQSVEIEENPALMGMVNKVKHLLKVEPIKK